MNKNSKIFVAGHKGMVGSSLLRILKEKGYQNLIYFNKEKLNFEDRNNTITAITKTKPDVMIIAAAKVGGINANYKYPYDFINKNLLIELNLIEAAYINKVKKLIFLGSSCVYPKFSKQPIKEEYLLSGSLEFTNRAYAIAKIAGIELCASLNREKKTTYLNVMPCNLYGPNDNYDLNNSHVLPALMKKIVSAKLNKKKFIEVWGTGRPLREFMYVDDLSECIIYLLNINNKDFKKIITFNDFSLINVGTGQEISIINLAKKISSIVNYEGSIKFNSSYHDGTPRKVLDVKKINSMGWKSKTNLDEGIKKTYLDYLKRETLC